MIKKWIAYAAYRCEIAGFATDAIDIQCRYFEFENEADIEPALQAVPMHNYQNEAGETVASKDYELRLQNQFARDNILLWEIDAHTYEEMMAVHTLRCGFGSYNPQGEPENCPKFSGYFYPQGSGDCWHCGKIC